MAPLKLFPPLILVLAVLSHVAQQPPPPPPPAPASLLNASETLGNSGYIAMSLTLQLIIPEIPLPNTSITPLTIFSPPDAAFTASGQPSLAQLLLHFSPLSLSSSSLLSLPFASTIPSLSPSKHLTITSTQPNKLSINNVSVSQSPIFDDRFVMVYAIDDFFDLNYTLNVAKLSTESDLHCCNLEGVSRFYEASRVLKSRGCHLMALFLDLQIMGFLHGGAFSQNSMKWTVFAPVDEELMQYWLDGSGTSGYSSLFFRHLVPCKLGWSDIDDTVNGTVVSTNVEGFGLEITKDADDEKVMVNGVEIIFPDMYDSEWLVIHWIGGVIALPESSNEETKSMEPSGSH